MGPILDFLLTLRLWSRFLLYLRMVPVRVDRVGTMDALAVDHACGIPSGSQESSPGLAATLT